MMWRRWFIAAALLAQAPAVVAYGATSAGLAAMATPTAAPPASATPTESGWSVQGEVTGRALVANDVGVDDQGTPAGQNLWLQTRLIAGASYIGDKWGGALELEAANGTLPGGGLSLGTAYSEDVFMYPRDGRSAQLTRVLPRKAMLWYQTSFGRVLVGPQVFQWGLGMLANDGRTETVFGDPRQGNVNARLAFATRPLARSTGSMWRKLTVFVAADLVLRDDNAVWFDGDRAFAGVLGARLRHDSLEFGALLAVRDQTDRADPYWPDRDAPHTRVVAMDAYGRKSLALADGRALHLEGEVASIIGSTSRPFTGETVDGASVRSLGALLRFRLEDRGSRTQTQLELGYASGDNDPGDDVARAFSFHSDCNVGLVLFDQVLPALGARAVDRLADPVLMARRPTSLRYVVNQGAVQGAAYFNPTVRWRPTSAVDVRLGYLLAASAGLSFDPYHTGLNGGYAAGYDGRAAAAALFGHEFDAAVGFTLPLPAGLSVRAGVEGGILLPGAALAGVSDLGNPWMVRTRLDLRFGGLRR